MLHVVGDDDDGIVFLERRGQFLNFQGGNGVKSGGRLVHQKYLRLHRQGSCDAQPLLLAAGKTQSILFQPVFYLVPDGGVPEGALHDLVQLGLIVNAMGAGAVGDVVVNAHGEGVGLLEHHAHFLAQVVDLCLKNVLALVAHVSRDPHAGDQVVHAVQGF